MKQATIEKVLTRYIRGLDIMEQDAKTSGEPQAIVAQYQFDKKALASALAIVKRKE